MSDNLQKSNGNKKTIIIADDEKEILSLLEINLRELTENFDIYSTQTSQKALERLKEGKIAALVTDGELDSPRGGLTGVQLARHALNLSIPISPQAIYIFTGNPYNYLEEASKLGVKVLPKPLGIKALKGYLDFYLNQSAIS